MKLVAVAILLQRLSGYQGIAHGVDLAGVVRGQRRLGGLDDHHLNAVQLHGIRRKVVGILDHHIAALRIDLGDNKCAVAHIGVAGLGPDLLALHHVLLHREEVGGSRQIQEIGGGIVQGHFQGLGVHGLHRHVIRAALSLVVLLAALDIEQLPGSR